MRWVMVGITAAQWCIQWQKLQPPQREMIRRTTPLYNQVIKNKSKDCHLERTLEMFIHWKKNNTYNRKYLTTGTTGTYIYFAAEKLGRK